jgi:hypothetical protein
MPLGCNQLQGASKTEKAIGGGSALFGMKPTNKRITEGAIRVAWEARLNRGFRTLYNGPDLIKHQ